MTPLRFGMPEVQHWAAFSGDFNPIHFEAEQARRAGLDDLVVHGMLALLPIKLALAEAHAAGRCGAPVRESRWLRFNALFRSPVLHDATSVLALQPSRTGGLDFRLLDQQTQRERFRGSFGPAADHGGWLQAHPLAEQDFAPLPADAAAHFAASYPAVAEGWITLDAIVFSEFMRHRLGLVAASVQQELQRVLGGASAQGLFVQASHSVCIDTQALASPGPWPFDGGELACAMAPPALVASRDKLAGSVSLPVVRDGQLVMLVEIGLLAKPSPGNP